MRVYEALAAACRRQGAGVAFGLVGDGNVKFAHHWHEECGGDYVAARHEAGAVSMAAGYARSTGRVGLATVTQGPGLTNALTAITAAAKGRIPMVLVTGLPPTTLPGHPQAIDQQGLLATAGAGYQEVSPASVLDDVATAFERAARERLPIGVCVPTDVQDGEGEHVPLARPKANAQRHISGPAGGAGSAASVSRAADLIVKAERPLIVAGRGVLGSPGAREALQELADRIGALLVTTLPVRGFFEGHPFALGVLGGFSSDVALEHAADADCILAFGASLNYRATRSGTLFNDHATVVQCDLAEDPPGASVPVDQRLVGDAAATARDLTSALDRRGHSGQGMRTASLAERLRRGDVHAPFRDRSRDGRVDPRSLMLRLDERLPVQRSVTVDGGHSSGFPSVYLRVPDHHGYLFSLEFASIGLGLGTAIGAAVGRPERLSVLVVGDGALLMSLPDVETAARQGVPVVVIVMNDDAYGSELAILSASGLPPALGLLGTPDLAAVARALGGDGLTVRSLEDVEAVADRWSDLAGPLLVDCKIDQELRGPWMQGAFNRSLASR